MKPLTLLTIALTCFATLVTGHWSLVAGQTVKITTFNVSWLGCPSQSPNNDELQIQNVAEVIKKVDADIVALQEITMSPVNSLEALLEHLGSEWGGEVKLHAYNNSCYQDMGIIYKKANVSLTSSAFISNGWARNPALYSMKVAIGGKTMQLEIVNIHAKATSRYSDDPEEDYKMRKTNSTSLKTVLDRATYNTKNVIIIGDYNDYLEGTQCKPCAAGSPSPYKNFMDDVNNYKGLTRSFASHIDHITISNELFPFYVSNSVARETAVTATIPSYRSTTSDHTPVSITLDFDNATAAPKTAYSAQLQLFPNPVRGELSIESGECNIAAVKVFSLSGVLVFEQKNIHAPQHTISTSAWQSGAYIVTVYSEKGEAGSKLVIRD
ncbi:MAG: endonuclease/exonuclease/phosphatase family protein [Prevotellaceae bacterium]|jgi:endonuclease/exonuclease/phosphatase family metal-dependent hydrolase|nr:endonuclease/exonuclease/phosphatase family protein [Prevotellaceae bacterium]